MDYGKILTRAWEIVRNNLFLIVLGVLVALGSVNVGNGNSGGSPSSQPGITATPIPGQGTMPDFSQMNNVPQAVFGLLALGIGIALVVVTVLVLAKIILWIVSRIASGSLIAAVDQIERGGTSSLAQAWEAGWDKKGRLVAIGLIPVLPALCGFAVAIVAVVSMLGGFSTIASEPEALLRDLPAQINIILVAAAILCPALLLSLALEIVAYFAERACMLEDKRFGESFGRGWEVLRSNLGSAIILVLIQIVIQIVLFLVLLIPGIILGVCCCCIAWVVFLAIHGAVLTYFSTVWTLAWRQWTGGDLAGSFTIEKAPAV